MNFENLTQTLISLLGARAQQEKKKPFDYYSATNFSDYYYQMPRAKNEPMCHSTMYWSRKRQQRLRRKKILDEKKKLRKEAKMAMKKEEEEVFCDDNKYIVIDE